MHAKQFIATTIVFFTASATYAQQTEVGTAVLAKTRTQVIAESQKPKIDGNTSIYMARLGAAVVANKATRAQSENATPREKTFAELQDAKTFGRAVNTSFAAYDIPSINAADTVTGPR